MASSAQTVAPVAATPAPAAAAPSSFLNVSVEFSGGLELLFSRQKKHKFQLPITEKTPAAVYTMRYFIDWLRVNACTERQELFVAEDSVRPGILVLINDCDWELEDGLDYKLKDGDTIVFISTLHGG